jgi:hypothetical protein
VRIFRFGFIVAIALALLFVGILVLFPIYINVCEKAAESTHYNCTPQNIGLIALRKLGEIFSDGNFLVALTTAIATAFMAWFTLSIRDINRNQLIHARQVERAYISGGWGRYGPGDRLYASINNYGRTPATVHHMAIVLLHLDGLPPIPPTLTRKFVNHDVSGTRSLIADHVWVTWDGAFAPERVFYGRFWYTNIFHDEHESRFLLHVREGWPAVDGFPEYWRWT